MRALTDRIAVITGAAGGIGRALSLELARRGMHIALADMNESGLDAVAVEVAALGRRAVSVPTDVRGLASVETLLSRTLSELGGCHLVANNAGVFHGASLLATPNSEWHRIVETNLWGVIHGCRVFGSHFVQQHEGHIVNMASAAGLFPIPGMSAYSTTKFAVVGLSRQLRWELAAEGVGVTLVCPGVVKTGIGKAPGVGLEHLDLDTALKRAPPPEGLARKVARAVVRDRALVRYAPDSYFFSALRLLPAFLIEPLGRFMAKTALQMVRKPASPG